MNTNTFNKARKWICLNARPIDRARFQYLFEGGSKEAVLSSLMEYQNEDGGFGHALEADSFNPLSSPIQTWAATEILREIHLEVDHPIIEGILRYLESGKDFNGICWLNSVPTNNEYPGAPWWGYTDEEYDVITYNPTAALAGFGLLYGKKGSAFYDRCYRIAQSAIKYLKETDHCDEMHILACYVRMAEYCRQAGLLDELPIDELEELLKVKVKKIITWDFNTWRTGYICKPSHFFHSNENFLYQELKEVAAYECSFIMDEQCEDGTWSINWSWDQHLEEWHIAKNWWKAHLIIMNLAFLKGIDSE